MGKTLCLKGYTLSQGHANALARACTLFDNSIKRILFDNCGVDDEEFAAILWGLGQLNDFKSIIYKRNVFDQESLEAITPLMRKKLPNHLEELKIIDCRVSSKIINDLI